MVEFDPAPETDESRVRWDGDADTFDRIYDVVLGISEPTSYKQIAEVANCSPNAAKKHLDRLAEMGVVRADTKSRPARYARNHGYLEWRTASRIAENNTVEEIVDHAGDLEAERELYRDRFDATDPSTVSVLDDDHDSVHDRMVAMSDWQSIDREIRLYELARRLAQNDGHLISA